LVAALAVGCGSSKDTAANARELNGTIDAIESFSLAFRDSVYKAHDTTHIALGSGRDPTAAGAVPDACETPMSQAPMQPQETPQFSISLPVDFEPVEASAADTRARQRGLAAYEWHGEDNSRIRIASRVDTIVQDKVLGWHRGWTGAMSSECDSDVNGRPAHIDVASAGPEDQVIHEHLTERELGSSGNRTIVQSLVLVAHARSIERQRDLLRSARTVQLSGH
jgi:hypothetical protein